MPQAGLSGKAVVVTPKNKGGRPPKPVAARPVVGEASGSAEQPVAGEACASTEQPVVGVSHRLGANARNRQKTNARVSKLEQRVLVLEEQLQRCMRAGFWALSGCS